MKQSERKDISLKERNDTDVTEQESLPLSPIMKEMAHFTKLPMPTFYVVWSLSMLLSEITLLTIAEYVLIVNSRMQKQRTMLTGYTECMASMCFASRDFFATLCGALRQGSNEALSVIKS